MTESSRDWMAVSVRPGVLCRPPDEPGKDGKFQCPHCETKWVSTLEGNRWVWVIFEEAGIR